MVTPEALAQAQKRRFIFNLSLFEEQIGHLVEKADFHFTKITRGYAFFQLSFFVFGLVEVLSFLLFFSFFGKSSLIAFSVAAIFLTAFSYFVLRFYFQAKKPEQFDQLQKEFVQACGTLLPLDDKVPDLHLSITHALYRLIEKLEGKEASYYALPRYFNSISPVLEKLSFWFYWEDVHRMREILHLACIRERIDFIKTKPTDLEAHASLANSYIGLYRLYLDPRKLGKQLTYPFIIRQYYTEEMVQKFREAAQKAIEEFRILDYYAPGDPWVHLQLAEIYHDLEEPLKEIKEYEVVQQISMEDRDVLFRLGTLYFLQGETAQGLKIYEKLKKAKDLKAEQLIELYGFTKQ